MNNSKDDWPLVDPCDDGIRIAPRGSDRCYYCEQVVGQPHQRDCDTIKKIVRVRCIVEVDVFVRHCSSKEDIKQDEVVRMDVEDALSDGDCDLVHLEFAGVVDETPWRRLRNANSRPEKRR